MVAVTVDFSLSSGLLDREMTLIQSVAQTFYDMDKGLADAAGNLATDILAYGTGAGVYNLLKYTRPALQAESRLA